ncbi:MAG: ATP phosphoribosyltransferase regulatory subunit, partial [Lachnospiraceae bacterium]|nr:ATP phosphoribosyltransferase regulatory subunit [Lachnospiraceae bacterium]
MNNINNTPEGVRDIAPSKLEKKLELYNTLLGVMKEAGYLRMQTPSFEYFDVFADNIGMTPSSQLYKFYDKEGNTLVLRPDFTPPMARAYSALYHDETAPVGLCYGGNTFVNGNDLNGDLKESTQVGAELYNDASCEADAKMISLIVKCMKCAGFDDFIVSVGNVDFFRGLCEASGISDEDEVALWKLISSRNYFKAQE